MDDPMTISEYEMFGVNDYAYAKDSRDTVGKGIPTTGKQETKASTGKEVINMANETEVKSAALCLLALLLGLCCALMVGCKTSAKVEGGAEIIELKPLEMQELTVPDYDYRYVC
tara:strand:- start:75 stop:416 length:342 start_codon:yes stop_codon:yes gene_type:complete